MDERTIFMAALEREDLVQQSAFLDQECAGNPKLRERVDALLRSHKASESFLRIDAQDMAPTLGFAPIAEKPGMKIGRYKLIHEIGHGGMGVVYMAVQKEPVKRKVALKIIKPGMDTREVVSRFEGERQALAMMDHQSIAKVLDGGSTESGRPYFVMELVDGTRITEFCDEARYNTRQRLELFGQVCQAVQHAHQKGIIHRDLKPSNILVTNYDDVAVPKVIDFGIARAVHQPLTDQSVYTNVSQMIGTPLYMSPEQAQRSGLDIDTRTDVYSLGVLLYELLTGTTPFDRDRLQNSSIDEVKRIIQEEEPPRPSTRLSTLDAALETVAEKHSTDLRCLCQELSGELDWIVMKALEKDRNQRYESANELAKDVQRYLDDELVEACPPSRMYQFGKFARRHRAALLSGTAVLLSAMMALVAVTLVSLSQRKLADHQRELADQRVQVQQEINDALTEVARLRGQAQLADQNDKSASSRAREQAQRQLALAEAGPADPQLLAQVQRLNEELEQERRDQQLLDALERAWLAQAQTNVQESRFLGEAAIPRLKEAIHDYGIAVGEVDPQQAALFVASKPTEIRTALLVAFDEWRRALRPPLGISLSENSDGSIIISSVVNRSAQDLRQGDRLVGIAEGKDQPIVDIRNRRLADVELLLRGEPDTFVQLEVISPGQTRSKTYRRQRDPTAAWLRKVADLADPDPWRCKLREARQIQDAELERKTLEGLVNEADVTKHPTHLLAVVARRLNKLGSGDQGIQLLTKLRAKSPGDLWVNAFLGNALSANSQHEEALRYLTTAVALQPQSAGLRLNLGFSLSRLGREQDAVEEYCEAIRLEPNYWAAHINLGTSFQRLGKAQEAINEHREAIRLKPSEPSCHASLGDTLAKLGRWQEAIVAYRDALRLQPDFLRALNNLGGILCDVVGDYSRAETIFRRAIQVDPDNARYHMNLARSLEAQGKLDEAITACQQALRLAPEDPAGHNMLGNIHSSAQRWDEALVSLRRAVHLMPDSAMARVSLAYAHFYTGALDDAQRETYAAIRLDPDLGYAHGFLAWCFASPKSINRSQEDRDQAIMHAKRAVELSGEGFLPLIESHTCLGVALFRNGQLDEAATHLSKVIELESAAEQKTQTGEWDKAICSFFLAMTRWQQGQKDEARRWYDEAEAWRKEHKPDNAELLRFQAEAGELLEIELPEPAVQKTKDKTTQAIDQQGESATDKQRNK